MLTWKFWRALHDPPANHPAFVYLHAASSLRHPRLGLWAMAVTAAVVVLLLASERSLASAFSTALTTPAFILPVALLLFTGTAYGLASAARISAVITRLRLEGKYDLLCVAPGGKLPIHWAICTGYLHRNQAFSRIGSRRARITQSVLMIPGAMFFPIVIGAAAAKNEYALMLLSSAVAIVTVAAAFYIDHMQSVVISGLVGMNIPNYVERPLDAALLAAASFLSIQLVTYAVAWWAGFTLLPEMLMAAGDSAEIALAVTRLGIFYFSRELAIACLWSLLSRQLEARFAELTPAYR